MAVESLPPIRGHVQLYLLNAEGEEELAAEADNLFVNTGYQQVATLLAGVDTPFPQYMAIGTVASPTISGSDTALGNETSRKAITSSGVVASYTTRFAAFWTAAEAQGTITEVGLFVNASGPPMLARAALSATKGAQSMTIVWQLQLPTVT